MSNEHVNGAFHYALNQICPSANRQAQPKCSFDMRPIKAAIAPLATMGEPVKPVFEVSEDQNVVNVAARLQFVEGGNCDMCAANINRCDMFPCLPVERRDGKRGHFEEVRG